MQRGEETTSPRPFCKLLASFASYKLLCDSVTRSLLTKYKRSHDFVWIFAIILKLNSIHDHDGHDHCNRQFTAPHSVMYRHHATTITIGTGPSRKTGRGQWRKGSPNLKNRNRLPVRWSVEKSRHRKWLLASCVYGLLLIAVRSIPPNANNQQDLVVAHIFMFFLHFTLYWQISCASSHVAGPWVSLQQLLLV